MTTTLDKIRRKPNIPAAGPSLDNMIVPEEMRRTGNAPSTSIPLQHNTVPPGSAPTLPGPRIEDKIKMGGQTVPDVQGNDVKTKQAEQDKNITADVHYRTGDAKTDAYIDKEIERTDPSRPGYQKPTDYTGFIQRMKAGEVPTPEQRLKEAKRRKREALISAIGDGISAMSNLYFTSKDAPNAYDPKDSLSAKSYARWQQLKDQRKKDKDAYEAALLNAKTMDDASMNNERNYRQRLLAMRNQQQHYDRNYALQVQKMQQEADRRAQERQDKLDQQGVENDRENKKMGETQRHNKRMEGAAYLRANNTGKGSGRKVDYTPIAAHNAATGQSEVLNIPTDKWNTSNISTVYKLLGGPQEIENGKDNMFQTKYRKPTTEEMKAYIGSFQYFDEGGNPVNAEAYNYLKALADNTSTKTEGPKKFNVADYKRNKGGKKTPPPLN